MQINKITVQWLSNLITAGADIYNLLYVIKVPHSFNLDREQYSTYSRLVVLKNYTYYYYFAGSYFKLKVDLVGYYLV